MNLIIQVAKQRNGKTGVFEIHWNPELMMFSDEELRF